MKVKTYRKKGHPSHKGGHNNGNKQMSAIR